MAPSLKKSRAKIGKIFFCEIINLKNLKESVSEKIENRNLVSQGMTFSHTLNDTGNRELYFLTFT